MSSPGLILKGDLNLKRKAFNIFNFSHREIHNAISSHHRRDNTMTTLLTGIVIVFFICHSTKIITHTYEAYQVCRINNFIDCLVQMSKVQAVSVQYNCILTTTINIETTRSKQNETSQLWIPCTHQGKIKQRH